MRLSDKTLQGRSVISADGTVIGAVAELFISDWHVDAIRIVLSKDIADRVGANRSLFHRGTIELPVSFIQSVGGDAVVLAIDVGQLREAHRPLAPDATSRAT